MRKSRSAKANSEIERYYFERFRKVYDLPSGTVCYADKPDVLLKGERKTIGIEITRFYIDSNCEERSEQRQRPLREKIVSEAHQLYLEGGGKNISLMVGFNLDSPIKTNSKRNLTHNLFLFEKKYESQSTGDFYSCSFPDMPEINFIWLDSKTRSDCAWRCSQVYSFREMSSSRLKDIIADKELKAANYASCNSYWLLIVVDGSDRAQDQEISKDNLSFSSKVFEKIILYRTVFEEVFELNQ